VYQYDGTGFEGTIALNDTLTKSTVGTYHYTAKEIRDNRYGITAFDCNTLAITFVDTTAPAANAGPDQTVEEDTPVSFDGTESSDIVGITSYTWTFTDVTLQTLTGEKPTYTFATPGTYTVTLEVADDAGNSASDTFVITVLDITNPVANAGVDRTTAAGASVSLDAGGSADNVGITSYEWSLGDGNSKSGKTIEHTYAKPGTYTVTLTAKDAAGNFAKDTVMVRVDDITPPVADAGSDRTVKVGEAVTFDARGSTDDVGVTSYEWDFGDGNTGTGITAIHTYEEAGTYAVALTVKDAAGNTKMDTATVTVAAEPRFSWIIPGIGAVIVAALAVLYLVVARRRSQKISTY